MGTHSQFKLASPPTIYADNFLRDSRIGNMILKQQQILNTKQIEILDPPVVPTDATNKAYVDSMTGGNPSTPNNSIQFNNGGTFGGSSDLTWSGTSLNTTTVSATTVSATTVSADTVAINYPPVALSDGTNKAYVDSLINNPGGISTNVQFNQGGVFAGSNDFVWNNFTKFLYINGRITLPNAPINPSDATNKAYVDAATGSAPGGPAMSVQFNSNPAGVFTGSNDYTWDNVNKIQSVNGSIVANNYITTSDVKFKSNFKHIDNPLDILSKIEGYSYNLNNSSKRNYGVIAQDIEKIDELSDIVNDCGTFKAVDYQQFVPLLIESVKQMNTVINDSDRGRRDFQALRKKRYSNR